MAVRQPSATTIGIGAAVRITWSGLLTTDNGDAIDYAPYLNKTFHVFGTFGGASVTIQGSNDGTNWGPLNDATNAVLSLTSVKPIRRSDDIPQFVRPVVVGGDGTTNLTVVCLGVAYQAGGGR